MNLEAAVTLFLPILAFIVVWYMVELASFFRFIAKNDRPLWEKLGKPTLFTNNSMAISRRFVQSLTDDTYSSSETFLKTRGQLNRIRALLYIGIALVMLWTVGLVLVSAKVP